MPNKIPKDFRLPPIEFGEHDHGRTYIASQIRRVRALQNWCAPRIIASGVFSDDDHDWMSIELPHVGVQETRETLDRLTAFTDALEQANARSGRLPDPLPDDPDWVNRVDDVARNLAQKWGEIGFLLGLAVGLQLGPSAFGGGQ